MVELHYLLPTIAYVPLSLNNSNNESSIMKNYLKRCTLILSVILLVSCSKPPGCASEDALQGIRNDLVAIDGTKCCRRPKIDPLTGVMPTQN